MDVIDPRALTFSVIATCERCRTEIEEQGLITQSTGRVWTVA